MLVLLRSLAEWGVVKGVKCLMALSTRPHRYPAYLGISWELKVTCIVAYNHWDWEFSVFFVFSSLDCKLFTGKIYTIFISASQACNPVSDQCLLYTRIKFSVLTFIYQSPNSLLRGRKSQLWSLFYLFFGNQPEEVVS